MEVSELKELFEAHQQGLKAEIKAGNDMLGYKIDSLNIVQKDLSSRLLPVETYINECKQNSVLTQLKDKPLRIIAISILVLFGIAGLINMAELLKLL